MVTGASALAAGAFALDGARVADAAVGAERSASRSAPPIRRAMRFG
jgi:hypothetical protein